MSFDKPIIIHGPQGCGKSTHAAQFQAHFGGELVDPWEGGEPLPGNALALTHREPPYSEISDALVFSFTEAMDCLPKLRPAASRPTDHSCLGDSHMTLCETELLILKAIHFVGGTPTVKELSAYLPEALAKSKGISSRLCDLRKKGMTQSEMSEVGVNHWALTCNGADALLVAGTLRDTDDTPDISVVSDMATTQQNQPDSPDLAPDTLSYPQIPDESGTIFDTVATAREEFNDLGTPFCADMDPNGVSDDLVEEANSLRLQSPFPHPKDALYVLYVLIDTLGRDYPAMAYELTRVAAYLEGEVI